MLWTRDSETALSKAKAEKKVRPYISLQIERKSLSLLLFLCFASFICTFADYVSNQSVFLGYSE